MAATRMQLSRAQRREEAEEAQTRRSRNLLTKPCLVERSSGVRDRFPNSMPLPPTKSPYGIQGTSGADVILLDVIALTYRCRRANRDIRPPSRTTPLHPFVYPDTDPRFLWDTITDPIPVTEERLSAWCGRQRAAAAEAEEAGTGRSRGAPQLGREGGMCMWLRRARWKLRLSPFASVESPPYHSTRSSLQVTSSADVGLLNVHFDPPTSTCR
ncbi:hypothetical protein C8R45DRAFT_175250 [Mycena sanguinolenta]|nr:hypothetical protein C8R45DRAFT_175250 [Mycena sanguinolenta]